MNLFHFLPQFRSKATPPSRLPRKVEPRRRAEAPPLAGQLAFDWSTEGAEADFAEQTLEKTARMLLELAGAGDLAPKVRVRWNTRLRTTAGLACFGSYLVSLNPRLIPFGMPEVDRTLRHELGHLLARHRAGRKRITPHGPEWKQACCDLGLVDEKRCHDLPLPRREVEKKHLYCCKSCGLEVKRVRPFRRAVACLKCCREFNRGKYHDRFRLEKVAQ